MSWIIWTILGLIGLFIVFLVWSLCATAKEADEMWRRAVERAERDHETSIQ